MILTLPLAAQKLDWAQQFGGSVNDIAWKVSYDNDENYYVLGEFSTTLPLDSLGSTRNLTSEGGRDIYLAKYNCSRVLQWRLRVGGIMDDGGEFPFMGLKVLPNGDIYFSGSFNGAANFYDAALVKFITKNAVGASDYFLAKVNSNGFYAWVASGGGPQNDENTSLEVDAIGNVYCAGFFTGTSIFGSVSLPSISRTSAGSSDIFIAKYNSSGIIQAVATAGGASLDVANHIAIDEIGNLYVAGNYSCCSGGTALFGTHSVNNISGWGAFIAKLVITGSTVNWAWVNHIGGSGHDGFSKVTIDKTNQAVYALGHSNLAANAVLSSQAPGASYPISITGGFDIVTARFDYNGSLVWAKTFGGNGDDYGYSMAIDKGSNLLIAGSFSNTVTFGSQNLVTTSAGSGYIATLNPANGTPIQTIKLSGTSGIVTIMDLEVSNRNYLYASGYFTDNLQVNANTISVNGPYDGFVAGLGLPDSLTLVANKFTFNCKDSIRLTANSLGGTLFNWFRNDTFFKQTDTKIIYTSIPGTYKVIALKKCASADTSAVVVLTQQDIFSSISAPVLACYGDSVTVSLTTNASAFSWGPAHLFNHLNYNQVKVFSDTTRYLYVLSQLGSCFKKDSVLITVKKPIISILPSPPICKGDTIQLSATGAFYYVWRSNQPLSDSLIAKPKVWPQQNATYYVSSILDGCLVKDSINIMVIDIQSKLQNDTLICLGDTITINTDANYSNVLWWPNYNISSTAFNSPNVWPVTDTNYILHIFQDGCVLKDTISIKVVGAPNLSAGNDVSLCHGSSVTLNAQGANKYAWYPNLAISDTTISNPTISPNQNITYYVLGSVGNCYVLDSLQVRIFPKVVSAFNLTPAGGFKPLNVVFTNKSSRNARIFLWEFGDGNTDTAQNPSNLYLLKGIYSIYLLAKDTNGCSDTSHQELTVTEEEFLYVPNVFTPQSDKLNDFFEPVYAIDQFPNLTLSIYSRWGELIWQTNMPGGSWWDGTFKGKDCPSDVYFYVLKAVSVSGKAYNLKGNVNLLR